MKFSIAGLAALTAAVLLGACTDSASPPFEAEEAAAGRPGPLSVADAVLFRGDTARLALTVSGRAAPAGLAGRVRWASSDPAVATVGAGGVVRAAGWGTATVTGSLGVLRARATVTVTAPPAVVLLVGDGMGEGSLQAARLRGGSLFLDALPVKGHVTTASASHGITDSGAAATALASGVLTYNGAIGVGPDRAPVASILETAEKRGMATGLVATSSLTHATPAAFAAHVPSRTQQMEIARQISASGVDVLLGGGQKYFLPALRPDGADLVAPFHARGCAVAPDLAGARDASRTATCLVGLLATEHLAPAPARGGALGVMAGAALRVLERDRDGFFLMLEGSQVDWAGHANDGEWNVAEMRDFDAVVGRVARALEGRPNTLLVVTADHETGGMGAERGDVPGGVVFTWSTRGHTDAPVPLRARGEGAQALAGTRAIDAVGRFVAEWLRTR